MKKITILTLFGAALILFGIANTATAIPFTSTVDFTGTDRLATDTGEIRTATRVSIPQSSSFTILHNIVFSPAAAFLNNATLTLSHNNNKNSSKEAWLLSDTGGAINIGLLAHSTHIWVDQVFDLTPFLATLGSFVNSSWTFALKLSDTSGELLNGMWIDKSVVSGDYTPVPEPATILLVGLGLVGLGIRRKKTVLKNQNNL